jgi:hypothetical protein
MEEVLCGTRTPVKAARVAVLVAGATLTALFVYVVGARIGFPFELEWMCGSVVDHVDRVRAGLPVYTEPTTRWIPYLYPPLFYWLGAALGGGFVACRAISLAAALAQAACIAWIAKRNGATRYWSIVAVLMFFAAYFYVGYWYDLERSDTLCAALVLVAAVVLQARPSTAGAIDSEGESAGVLSACRPIAAGVTLGAAFFAKQQALPFAVAAVAALLVQRQYKGAIALAAAAAAIIAGGTRWQDAGSGGWFSYYVWKMPAAHGIDTRLLGDVLDYDVPRGAVLIAATLGCGAVIARDFLRGQKQQILLGAMLAAGFVSAFASRLHIGGWINVLQFWTSFACPAAAVVATRAESWLTASRFARHAAVVSYAAIAQFALWVHSPAERVPNGALRANTERFLADIDRLRKDGEVLVVGRGHVTDPTHFQMSALADVARFSGSPADLLQAIRERRLAAIVDDGRPPNSAPPALWPPVMLEDVPALRAALFANYFVAERIDDQAGAVAMPAPALPRWVYLPRREPLAEGGKDVDPRHFGEQVLAARRSSTLRSGQLAPYNTAEIEELAARDLTKSR